MERLGFGCARGEPWSGERVVFFLPVVAVSGPAGGGAGCEGLWVFFLKTAARALFLVAGIHEGVCGRCVCVCACVQTKDKKDARSPCCYQ